MLKKVLVISVLCVWSVLTCAAVKVELSTRFPYVGQRVVLDLVSSEKLTLPSTMPPVKGVAWLRGVSRGSNTSWINGQTSHTYRYGLSFIPQQPGELTIPSFKVQTSKGTENVPAQKLKVRPASERTAAAGNATMKIAEVLQGKIVPLRSPTQYYVGETIPLQLQLFCRRDFVRQIRVRYLPELRGVEQAVLTNFGTRARPSHFSGTQERDVVQNEEEWRVVDFNTQLRFLKPGTYEISAQQTIGIVQRRSQSRDPWGDDDFFGGFGSFFNSSTVEDYPLNFAPPVKLKIAAVPLAPPHVVDSGLIGNFEIKARLSTASPRVGEVLELIVEAVADASGVDSARPVELSLPNFRVYPPEIKKQGSRVSWRYALVPLQAGTWEIKQDWGTFNPASGQFRVTKIALPLTVKPGQNAASAVVTAPSDQPISRVQATPPPATSRSELLYQKNSPGTAVKLPLIYNHGVLIMGLFIGAPALGLWVEYRRRRRELLAQDPARRAALEQSAQRKNLLKQLRRHRHDSEWVRQELLPQLGCSPAELAAQCDDEKLQDFLRQLEQQSFMPGASPVPLNGALCRKLHKLLKGLLLLLLLAGTTNLTAAVSEFNAQFDAGNFTAAAQSYAQALNPRALRPNLLYNLGNSLYLQKNLPLARYYLLQAQLLAPRDREIAQNLQFVEQKLHVVPENNSGAVAQLAAWRDTLRPDEWLLLAACAWAALWLIVLLRRYWGRPLTWSLGAVTVVIGISAIFMLLWQERQSYSLQRGVTVTTQVAVRSLPATTAGQVEVVLPGGGDCTIIEERADFVRIVINGRDGWVARRQVRRLLPAGLWR